ncbi:hypothetical protein VIN30_01045 [Adlercreutzia sp. R7]|uniref:Uncharacterized protein n=1 Tax=Adlercreutzia wanghongyangiae TaxID=3111451 RepID=A0ABU6IF24_9ACTN|nr:hypothetical protein [Adlercreutzia sp. R7]
MAFPPHLLTPKGEKTAKEQLAFDDARFNGLKKHVSCPVDVAYHDGAFAGLIVSHMRGGVSLDSYLELGKADRRGRRRVAHNLCVLVQLSSRFGYYPGRMTPKRVLVDPTTCRVFLTSDYGVFFRDTGTGGSLPRQDLPRQSEVDLAVHVCGLLQKKPPDDFEGRVWGDVSYSEANGPSAEDMRATVFHITNRPVFVDAIALIKGDTPLLRKLWGVPLKFRKVLEASLLKGAYGDARTLSYELCKVFEHDERNRRSRFSVLKARVKRFVIGSRMPAERTSELERRPWGLRGYGSAAWFWVATMWLATAVGICSAMNGFTPIDMALGALRGTSYQHISVDPWWLYVVAAAAGSAAYNLFVARRHPLSGYEKSQYCYSLSAAVLLMTLVGFIRFFLRGGAL